MIRHAFSDLSWLKSEVARRNADVRGWPTLILNATTTQIMRPEVEEPLSIFIIFINIPGTSHASVHGCRAQVDESVYFLTNPNQHYTFEMNSPHPVETFSIHLGSAFAGRVLHSTRSSIHHLPENTDEANSRHCSLTGCTRAEVQQPDLCAARRVVEPLGTHCTSSAATDVTGCRAGERYANFRCLSACP